MAIEKKNIQIDEEEEARINAAMFFEAMKAQGKLEDTPAETSDLDALKKRILENARKKAGN